MIRDKLSLLIKTCLLIMLISFSLGVAVSVADKKIGQIYGEAGLLPMPVTKDVFHFIGHTFFQMSVWPSLVLVWLKADVEK